MENEKESFIEGTAQENEEVVNQPKDELAPSNTRKGQFQRKQEKQNQPRFNQDQPEQKQEERPMSIPVTEMKDVKMADRPTVEVSYQTGGDKRETVSLRKRRAISLNISEKLLPPYTKGVIAKYRMLQTGQKDMATGEYPEPQDADFPGTYSYWDDFEADPILKRKMMMNRGRDQIIFEDNKEKKLITTIPILFVAGLKEVIVSNNYLEYVFMELHPCNLSNKHRDQSVTAQFERVDLQSNMSMAFAEAKRDLAIDAELTVMKKITDQDEILGYAVSMGIPTRGRKPSEIKSELRIVAAADPIKFFSIIKDLGPGIKVNIHAGMSNGLIEYLADKRQFVFTENDEIFHQCLVQEDPYDSIAKAIQKEPVKKALYGELVDMLNYWTPSTSRA